jgi:hypothetical protein
MCLILLEGDADRLSFLLIKMAQISTLKNTLLMVAPVAVLGGLGLLLKNREAAVFTVPGPFRVYIKKVRLVPIKPRARDMVVAKGFWRLFE